MSIILFSRPIHSGKTTELLQWCNGQKGVAGILMPDMDGVRHVLDIRTNETFRIQCPDPLNSTEPLTTVGKFHFYTHAFERANTLLGVILEQQHDWIVIDEAGKLELESKGFYPSLRKAVERYLDPEQRGTLLITVRESLCNEVICFFGLENCKVVHQTSDIRK